jgi:hypothetical protein
MFPEVEGLLKKGLTMVVVHQDDTYVAIFHEDLHGGCVPRFAQGTGRDPEEAISRAVLNFGLTAGSLAQRAIA